MLVNVVYKVNCNDSMDRYSRCAEELPCVAYQVHSHWSVEMARWLVVDTVEVVDS
jgi:hypothetical protein